MECWRSDFHRGVISLSRHDPGGAVGHFSRALRECPVARNTGSGQAAVLPGHGVAATGLPQLRGAHLDHLPARQAAQADPRADPAFRQRLRHGQAALPATWTTGRPSTRCRSSATCAASGSAPSAAPRSAACWPISSGSPGSRCAIPAPWRASSTAEKSALFQATNIDFPLFHQGAQGPGGAGGFPERGAAVRGKSLFLRQRTAVSGLLRAHAGGGGAGNRVFLTRKPGFSPEVSRS